MGAVAEVFSWPGARCHLCGSRMWIVPCARHKFPHRLGPARGGSAMTEYVLPEFVEHYEDPGPTKAWASTRLGSGHRS